MYKFQFQKYFFLNVQTECLYIIQDCTKFPLLHYIGETSPLDSMKKGLIIPVPSSLIRKGLHECLKKCIIKRVHSKSPLWAHTIYIRIVYICNQNNVTSRPVDWDHGTRPPPYCVFFGINVGIDRTLFLPN